MFLEGTISGINAYQAEHFCCEWGISLWIAICKYWVTEWKKKFEKRNDA